MISEQPAVVPSHRKVMELKGPLTDGPTHVTFTLFLKFLEGKNIAYHLKVR